MILALDTSTAAMTLALVDSAEQTSAVEAKVIAERSRLAERNHSILLVSQIDELMEEAGVSMEQLGAIAVGQGPGSYTGVRIGVTVAKTLAWSLRIPLIGISSLEALAKGVERKDFDTGTDWIVPLLDARRGNAYSALFAADSSSWTRLEQDKKRTVTDWCEQLEQRWKTDGPNRIWIAGDTERFESSLSPWMEQRKEQLIVRPLTVEARHIGCLGLARFANGEREAVHAFVPNYTQLAEVEAKFTAKQAGRDRSS